MGNELGSFKNLLLQNHRVQMKGIAPQGKIIAKG
jgi:hypothetical protein